MTYDKTKQNKTKQNKIKNKTGRLKIERQRKKELFKEKPAWCKLKSEKLQLLD